MFDDQAPPNLPTDEPQKPKGPTDEPKQRKTPPPAVPARAPAPKPPTASVQSPSRPSAPPAPPKQEKKVGAEDMFAGLDTGPKPARPEQSDGGAPQVGKPKSSLWKTLIIIVASILVLGFAAYGLWWLITTMTSPEAEIDIQEFDEEDLVEEIPIVEDQTDEVVPDVEIDIPDPVVETTPSKDSDGDGLSDFQEAQIGTSPTSTDTDVDQLSDYDEVMLYKSNPLDPDTDNDGYLDGEEVKNGYNPNGTGKLFEVPAL